MNVILVHGFNRNHKDLYPMKNHLEQKGYSCEIPNLPLTFSEFEKSTDILEKRVKRIESTGEKVHLVGHSTGGLVIQHMLSKMSDPSKVGRVVVIASPNRGSQLARFAGRYKWYVAIFKTLKSLEKEYIRDLNITYSSEIEVGAIAGRKQKGLFGKMIKGKNDGRVAVSSVEMNHFKDFLVLPYGHHKIHHQQVTADFVDRFLQQGHF